MGGTEWALALNGVVAGLETLKGGGSKDKTSDG